MALGGIIGGAMYGLGGAMQSVGAKAFEAEIEKEKAERLAELSAKFRAQDRQQEHELAIKRDESRYNLENRDRLAIKGELEKYSQPREEALAPDQAGPVGTITPSGSDIARQGGLIAGRMGRPDIANQYRQFGEPGKLETMAKEDEYKQAQDERAARAAKDLKQTAPAEGEAASRLARAHASYYEGAPGREDRASRRDQRNAEIRTGQQLLADAKARHKEAADAQKAFDSEYGGMPVEKLTPGQRKDRAMRLAEITEKRQSAAEAETEARALLRGGGRGGREDGGADVSEKDVLSREPLRSEEPPIKGAYLNDNGFWYGPDNTPVINRAGRPVRKSLDEKNDSNMQSAVDRDESGKRIESAPVKGAGLIEGAAKQTGGFNAAEQELIDEQRTEAGKRRVRNEILRQRQADQRRAAMARSEQEARAGEAEYARRGVDPRNAAR